MNKLVRLDRLLKPYQELIISSIHTYIPELGPKTHLSNACEYALLNGGKRVRPAIVLMLGKALSLGANVSSAWMMMMKEGVCLQCIKSMAKPWPF
jgi:geranylgeranyl pyrophosphate synthase